MNKSAMIRARVGPVLKDEVEGLTFIDLAIACDDVSWEVVGP